MIKKRGFFEKLISLLQGASWALVVVGGVTFFIKLYPISIFSAFLGAFLGSLFGLFFVVFFEIAQLQIEKLYEIKKQTALLEKLLDTKKEE